MDEGEELAGTYQMPFIESSAKNDICVQDGFITIASDIKKNMITPSLNVRPTSPNRKS